MNLLDFLVVVVCLFALLYGYRRGIVLLVAEAIGLAAGAVLGFYLAPHVADWLDVHDLRARQLTVLAVLAVAIAGISGLAMLAIFPLWRSTVARSRNARSFDNVAGGLVAAGLSLAIVWVLAASFDRGPSAELAQLIQQSRILRELDGIAPPPPDLVTRVEGLLASELGPNLFIGFEPDLPKGVSPSAENPSLPAIRTAATNVVKVLGPGCGGAVAGSGFAVAPNLVITNAHVVAGVHDLTVTTSDGQRQPATLRVFDPARDIAILEVAKLKVAPLAIGTAADGAQAAVIGYPGGGPERVVPAAVAGTIPATGRDIYGEHTVTRHVVVLVGDVRPGNSGGPLVDEQGAAIGLIYAASVSEPGRAFALATDEFAEDLKVAMGGGTAIDPRVKQCVE